MCFTISHEMNNETESDIMKLSTTDKGDIAEHFINNVFSSYNIELIKNEPSLFEQISWNKKYGVSCLPDFKILHTPIFIEVKTLDSNINKKQTLAFKKLEQAGFEVYVLWSEIEISTQKYELTDFIIQRIKNTRYYKLEDLIKRINKYYYHPEKLCEYCSTPAVKCYFIKDRRKFLCEKHFNLVKKREEKIKELKRLMEFHHTIRIELKNHLA